MNIKRYIAGSVQEAVQMVKAEMGPDAVILRTRTIRSPSNGGEAVKKVEVTAAVDYELPVKGQEKEKQEPGRDQESRQWERLEREFRELRELLLGVDMGAPVSSDPALRRMLRAHYVNFKRFGLRPEVGRELLNECSAKGPKAAGGDPELLKASLERVLAGIQIDRANGAGQGRRIVSFIGPTGVGKTTTLAKMAAMDAIGQGKKTALITLDTFRIGAVNQLQTYARIMGIPLEVACSRNELQRAIQRHKECDSLYIDTVGTSPGKDAPVRELRDLLDVSEKVHSFLVLSATTRYQNLLFAEEKFGVVPYGSYIFTKLDETPDASPMINFLLSRPRPVSYLTTGQQVPEDIEAASRKRLAYLILSKVKGMSGNPTKEVTTYGPGRRTEGHC